MKIRVRQKGKVTILDISGELTIAAGDVVLRDRFKELVAGENRLFILNMIAVPYIDSGGLAETVACAKRAVEKNGTLKIVVELRGKVHQVLQVTALDQAFEVFGDEEEAIASFIR